MKARPVIALFFLFLAALVTYTTAQEKVLPSEARESVAKELREWRTSLPKEKDFNAEEYYEMEAKIAQQKLDMVTTEGVSREEMLAYAELLGLANKDERAISVYKDVAGNQEDILARKALKNILLIKIESEEADLEKLLHQLQSYRNRFPLIMDDSRYLYTPVAALVKKAEEKGNTALARKAMEDEIAALEAEIPSWSWRLVADSLRYYEENGKSEGLDRIRKYEALFQEKRKQLEANMPEDESNAAEQTNRIRSYQVLERVLSTTRTKAELIGEKAPEFTFTHFFNTDELSLTELRGKVVLIDFWATWCGPCIATFAHLREFYEEYKPKGVEVIGVTGFQGNMSNHGGERVSNISKEKELELMPQFINYQNVTWPIAFSEQGPFDSRYGVSGIPSLIIIDKYGKVRLITHPANQDEIKETVDNLLKEEVVRVYE